MKKLLILPALILLFLTGCSSLSTSALSVKSKPFVNAKSQLGVKVKSSSFSSASSSSLNEVLYSGSNILGIGSVSTFTVNFDGKDYPSKSEVWSVFDKSGKTKQFSDRIYYQNAWCEITYNEDGSIKQATLLTDNGIIKKLDFKPYTYTPNTVSALNINSILKDELYNTFEKNSDGKIIAKIYADRNTYSTFDTTPVYNSNNQLIAYTQTDNFLDIESTETKYAKYRSTYNLNGVIIKIEKIKQ